MKGFAIFGCVLLYAACVNCFYTKQQLAGCAHESGAVKLVLEFDLLKLRDEGLQTAFCMAGCLMREGGYIDAKKNFDAAKMVHDFVEVLDEDMFNVRKLSEYEHACIRYANQENNECDMVRAYALCSTANLQKFAGKTLQNMITAMPVKNDQ